MRLAMNTLGVAFTVVATVVFSLASAAHDGKLTFAPVLTEAIPAVVSIQVEQGARRRPRSNLGVSAGSGVIIDAREGHVVTNHHVIARGERITVALKDRRSFEAELIGSDPDTDIALLRIDAENLQALPLGDSDELAVGDLVVAIGNPFGFGQTATSGIVSALGRSGFIRGGYEDFIQTDASINQGNSGGALVDLDGRLVGINTVIVSRSGGSAGLGFAVPTNIVRAVTEQLIEHGEVHRGLLGVSIGDVTPDAVEALGLKSDKGAVVASVVPGSAAEAAGIEPDDVILRMGGEDVENMQDLRNRVALASAGQDVEFVVMRGGKMRTIEATIGRVVQVDTARSLSASSLAGATFRDLSRQHRLFGRVDGVEVVDVERGSRASELGLEPGDVITAVDGRAVGSVGEFETAVADGSPYSIQLQRGNWQLSGVVR
ncbi:MAG: Do family serine endopeptidase [Gammaproteobacteria bacterium]|nr:Do family serine endopeptidase [Gammaproteobacteria bacterium]